MISGQHPQTRWSELFKGGNARFTLVFSLGILLHAVNSYITATMLPSIVKDIGGQSLYAWSTTVFMMTAVVSSAMGGNVMKRYGSRLSYFAAIVVLLAGSATAAVSPSMEILLVGRGLQGFGGGLLFSLCYSMIMKTYPERLWSRAIAMLSAMYMCATMFGPAIGGFFVELGHWRYGFLAMLPIGLLYLVFTLQVLPKVSASSETALALPVKQLFLLAASTLSISVASLYADSPVSLSGVVLSVMALFIIVSIDKNSKNQLFSNAMFSLTSPLLWVYLALALLIMSISVEVFLPFYMQMLHGQSPLVAGYIAVLIPIGWVIGEMFSARWTGNVKRVLLASSPVLVIIGALGLKLLVPGYSHSDTIVLVLRFRELRVL